MALTLYLHPLASFCHKVLIALYENGTPFESRIVDFSDPDSARQLLDRWPVGKIPLLHESESNRVIPETTVIIEYLQANHPGPVQLIPSDPQAALDVRLWDRFFDNYIQVPMQKIVTDRIRPDDGKDPVGVSDARASLRVAYDMLEGQLTLRTWATGENFTLADCAAAPGLFFAGIVEPFPPGHQALADYFERLLARPSVTRALDEAKPYFAMFPYRDAMPARFVTP